MGILADFVTCIVTHMSTGFHQKGHSTNIAYMHQKMFHFVHLCVQALELVHAQHHMSVFHNTFICQSQCLYQLNILNTSITAIASLEYMCKTFLLS